MKCKTEGCGNLFRVKRKSNLKTKQVKPKCPKCEKIHFYNKDGSYPAVWKVQQEGLSKIIVWEMICKTKGCGNLFTYEKLRSLITNQVRPKCPKCEKIGFYNKDGTPWAVWEFKPR